MKYGVQAPIPMWVGGTRKWAPGRNGRALTSVVIHRMEGTLDGSDSYLRREFTDYSPYLRLDASTHFGVGAWGWTNRLLHRYQIRQWVDTVNSAFGWAARPTDIPTDLARRTLAPDINYGWADLNWQVIHIEVEGFAAQPWPTGLASKVRELLNAIARVHGPLVVLYHTDCAIKPCPGVYWTDKALPGLHGNRIALPDTSLPKSREELMFEKWVPRILPTTGTLTLPSGTAVYHHPYIGQSYGRVTEKTVVEVSGRVSGDSVGGKSRWFIWTRNSGGLALVPEVNATNIKVDI